MAKLTHNTKVFGIMGGLAPMRNIRASTHVGYRVGDARMHQDIPLDPKRGLAYMMGQNPMGKYMLSSNPQCAGGVGRMALVSSRRAYTTPTRGKVMNPNRMLQQVLGDEDWTDVQAKVGWSSEPEYVKTTLCPWSDNPGNMCGAWPPESCSGSNACQTDNKIYFGHGIGGANATCGDLFKVRVKRKDGTYNTLCQLVVDNPNGTSNEIGADARAILQQNNKEGWNGNKGDAHQTADRLGFQYKKLPRGCKCTA